MELVDSPPVTEIDWWGLFNDPEYLRDPYPELKRIRQLAPIHYDPASGVYFVLGYRECALVLKAPELGRDTQLWTNEELRPNRNLIRPAIEELRSWSLLENPSGGLIEAINAGSRPCHYDWGRRDAASRQGKPAEQRDRTVADCTV
jgi:hypothetical protein